MELAFAVGGGGEESFANGLGPVVCVKFASFDPATFGQFQVASHQVRASRYLPVVSLGATIRGPVAWTDAGAAPVRLVTCLPLSEHVAQKCQGLGEFCLSPRNLIPVSNFALG